MRTIWYIVLIIASPLASIAFYMYFHILKFSENQVDWGAFGSFVGGVSAPVVAGITLIFLIQSGKYQAQQTAQKIALDLIDSHVATAELFEYPGSTPGELSFLALWNNLLAKGSADSLQFKEELKSVDTRMERLVRSSLYIVEFISTDTYLSNSDKNRLLDLWVSKLKRPEMKLFFALSMENKDIKKALLNKRLTFSSVANFQDHEAEVFKHITKTWKDT
ncbi:hypothetical protein V8049_004412 [Vibrio vulnificus]|nr:hypothetical protein [Vibrio vulnificus]EIV8493001.1 hypothetical protein [Vibrio vulnificus]PWF65564.1 hypothetical protein CCD93_23455 [Vibrio sp. T21]